MYTARFLFIALISLPVIADAAPDLAVDEVKDSPEVEFVNHNYKKAPRYLVEKNEETGKGLAIKARDRKGVFVSLNGVAAVRIDPGSENLGADIIALRSTFYFGHINSVRRIIAAYLQEQFGYEKSEAEVITWYVIYYNALHRQDSGYVEKKYNQIVLERLVDEKIGLSQDSKHWANQTQIILPVKWKDGQQKETEVDLKELSQTVDPAMESDPGKREVKQQFQNLEQYSAEVKQNTEYQQGNQEKETQKKDIKGKKPEEATKSKPLNYDVYESIRMPH